MGGQAFLTALIFLFGLRGILGEDAAGKLLVVSNLRNLVSFGFWGFDLISSTQIEPLAFKLLENV